MKWLHEKNIHPETISMDGANTVWARLLQDPQFRDLPKAFQFEICGEYWHISKSKAKELEKKFGIKNRKEQQLILTVIN